MTLQHRRTLCILICLLAVSAAAQSAANLVSKGFVDLAGKPVSYTVQHLPPASFPQLPPDIAEELTRRGCLIPQTYEAHRPENVVHGSFEQAGSSDWAVLCAIGGEVKLLVFFGSDPASPATLGSAAETQRLQAYPGSRELGFNWGIDPASPEVIRGLRDTMRPRPPRTDHDALADSVVDQRTIYHYFSGGQWKILDIP